jgi:sugar phosphate permease
MFEEKRWNISDSLQSFGIILIVLGIVFNENPVVGYSFIGAGILLAIISLIIRKIGRKSS